MNWNNRASSVFVNEKMVTTFGANNFKSNTAESAEEIFGGETRQLRHLRHRDTLNADKFTAAICAALDFHTEVNRLTDTLHQFVQ